MHYVIGDVHGYFDELMELIRQIEAKDSGARFIITGWAFLLPDEQAVQIVPSMNQILPNEFGI